MSPVAVTVIVGLAITVAVLAVALLVVVSAHSRERVEWTAERRALVDRALARHTGEVLALDRAANGSQREHADPILPVGLS